MSYAIVFIKYIACMYDLDTKKFDLYVHANRGSKLSCCKTV